MAFQFIQDSGEKGTTPHTWNIKSNRTPDTGQTQCTVPQG